MPPPNPNTTPPSTPQWRFVVLASSRHGYIRQGRNRAESTTCSTCYIYTSDDRINQLLYQSPFFNVKRPPHRRRNKFAICCAIAYLLSITRWSTDYKGNTPQQLYTQSNHFLITITDVKATKIRNSKHQTRIPNNIFGATQSVKRWTDDGNRWRTEINECDERKKRLHCGGKRCEGQ